MAISERKNETDGKGGFKRQTSAFTTSFGPGEDELPVESGRYRLAVSMICPWAHRQLIARELLGLQDHISVAVASPRRTLKGWRFSLDEGNRDPVLDIEYLDEAYRAADPDYSKRGTVPAFIDIPSGKVVNNNFHRLSNELEVNWAPLHAEDAPELYPEEQRAAIDEFNDWLFHTVNNGVYKCGFATTQKAYDEAYDALFEGLDQLEERLSTQRFLWGDYISDSDIRLYATLCRFDAAYYGGFKANRNRLIDFENLWGYARDLYQTPGFGSTTDFEAIKEGYFGGEGVLSEDAEPIIPKGPDQSGWDEPHDRARLSDDPESKFRAKSA
ncbi:glutathione S-transferase family protein [Corynebacterium pilosum]|uniref:Glutathione S-transferase n=1 Tax=Corynebacterium pilosum TaxID=35756 RepID=A0A376CNQ4_9CORY|nr:glutathione S-transferase C-terminal domain-containing protein [Corynebacterium pilosum]STC69288.1 glutathione S-transferase [Corynebacterium pilosum]